MARQCSVVDQDAMVADHAVVADVRIGHHQVVITQGGLGPILHGATVNGHPFTDDVVITHYQARFFTLVLHVRGVFAYRGELVDAIVFANAGRTFEDHVRPDDSPSPISTPAPMIDQGPTSRRRPVRPTDR